MPDSREGSQKTKCPAVRHFYPFRNCPIFVRIGHAIGKRRVASQLTRLRIKSPRCDKHFRNVICPTDAHLFTMYLGSKSFRNYSNLAGLACSKI